MNYDSLPSLIALAILVAVFRSIMRRSSDERLRLRLWLIGWVLVLLHFIAVFVDPGSGRWHGVMLAASLAALELAGITFLISFARVAPDRRRRRMLAAVLGASSVTYTTAIIWRLAGPWLWYGLTALAVAGVMLLIWHFFRELTAYVAGLFAGCLAFACVITIVIAKGRPELGVELILAAIYCFAGALYWQSYRRGTAGVLTSVLGLVAWGVEFPIRILLHDFAPSLSVPVQVWDLPEYFVAVGMILTLLEDQIKEREHLAFHDALTGVPNRRLLMDRLEQAFRHADRQQSKVAVLMIDVDNFKTVNDNFGHGFGDMVLKTVAARLTASMRASDTLSRTGGDEFVVVGGISDSTGARALTSTLSSRFPVLLEAEGRLIKIGISVGAALYPDDGHSADELLAAADRAMFLEKRAAVVRSA